MPKLQILIGNIASGKTTYCRTKLLEDFICVNDDAIVSMIHGGVYTGYDKNLKPLYKSIENQIINFGIALGKSVIVDRGVNIKAESRKRLIGIAKSLDVEVEAVVFPFLSDEEHAHRRYFSDSRGLQYGYWLGVARYNNKNYEPPTIEEGFSNIIHIGSN